MRNTWKPALLVGLLGSATVLGGEHFRIKAKLLPGAPRGAHYRHNDVVSRGIYTAMLEGEEVVEELNFIRQVQHPSLAKPSTDTSPAFARGEARSVPAKQTSRKVFRSSMRDVATTADRRSVDAAPIRLDDIRLAAYSDGRMLFTGRIQDLPTSGLTGTGVRERTDGCRVTIRVRGFSSTEVAATAVNPNGPMLFECVQAFWMSKQGDCAISLICPEDLRLCRTQYQELTHIQVEVETRRNR